MRWAGHVAATVEKRRNSLNILVGRSEWRRPF
jgi:hypothetical protein